MVRVWVIVAAICATVVTAANASSDPLPRGMIWVAAGGVRPTSYDPGGFLAQHLIDLERLKRLRLRQLQLDETCASACTVFLRLGEKVCVTGRTRIGFHRIAVQNRSGATPSRRDSAERVFNDRYLKRLPNNIRTWSGIRDGLPLHMTWLQGEEAARLIGRCR